MCLIVIAHRALPDVELLVAANRDEFFERPALPAAFWPDRPGLLAGRDLRAGGTWLGMTREGRFAAITNYRNPRDRRTDAPSRGALVGDFLAQRTRPADYLHAIEADARKYNGFSLLAAAGGELWFFSNYDSGAFCVPPGIHGLSNHLLNEPWPKVTRSKAWLARLIHQPFRAEDYFELLADETLAEDHQLPDTGIGLERERRASAIRIRDSVYGTRCSTVLLLRESGEAEFHERSFAPDGSITGTVRYAFTIER
ncbi:MAG: hypothetical protein A3I01_13005 [Betaproteobacteria bacterium RIFCSPLOWO2_02_FULL_65_24]|nr:MAG: hypothetical protein A3I01_13005 [Betaproteobacteria bacterium RIFCSPLOWO2_02_FULL_65_24]OGA87622.1 MAG: hypothetical protein A3G27_18795 [Betaproteobacteria bacterium RIFCSPLOWO2_12_FULL_66_14]